MSKLTDFLNPLPISEEKEVYISERFVRHDTKGEPLFTEDGSPVLRPFKIRAISQKENDELVKQSTKRVKVNGKYEEQLDSIGLTRRIIVASTIEPDFRDKELCDSLGILDPMEAPGKMLLPGEYNKLSRAILEISGFADDDDIIGEAKN